MGTATYDSLNDMQTLLKGSWGTTDSSGDLPEIKIIWDKKVVGFADYTRDTVLLTPKRENIEYFGLYGLSHMHHVDIEIQLWTYMNQDRLDNIVKEVTKIIKDNIRRTNFVEYMETRPNSEVQEARSFLKNI